MHKMFMPAWGDVPICSIGFLNFVQQRGTVTRFESPSRHKHKRYGQPHFDIFSYRTTRGIHNQTIGVNRTIVVFFEISWT